MPSQRRLPEELKEKAVTMIKKKANKKLVREEIARETGKVVTMKDVHNLTRKVNMNGSRNNLQEVLTILRNDFGMSAYFGDAGSSPVSLTSTLTG